MVTVEWQVVVVLRSRSCQQGNLHRPGASADLSSENQAIHLCRSIGAVLDQPISQGKCKCKCELYSQKRDKISIEQVYTYV